MYKKKRYSRVHPIAFRNTFYIFNTNLDNKKARENSQKIQLQQRGFLSIFPSQKSQKLPKNERELYDRFDQKIQRLFNLDYDKIDTRNALLVDLIRTLLDHQKCYLSLTEITPDIIKKISELTKSKYNNLHTRRTLLRSISGIINTHTMRK